MLCRQSKTFTAVRTSKSDPWNDQFSNPRSDPMTRSAIRSDDSTADHEFHTFLFRISSSTVEPQFNEPLYNKFLDINERSFFSLAKVTIKYMEQNLDITNLDIRILVITNAIRTPKRKIYPDITNKCYHLTKDECETDKKRWKSFNLVTREQLFSERHIYCTVWHWHYWRKI